MTCRVDIFTSRRLASAEEEIGRSITRDITFWRRKRRRAKGWSRRHARSVGRKVEKVHGTDKVVLKKRGMHYGTVGQRLEKILSEHFDKEVHVTRRSMRTVEGLVQSGI